MAIDACDAYFEPPTHKRNWKSSSFLKKYHQSRFKLHLDAQALCEHVLACLCTYIMFSYFMCIGVSPQCVCLFSLLNHLQPFIFLVTLPVSLHLLNSGLIDAQVFLPFALDLNCFNQSHTNLTVPLCMCVCVSP